MCFHLGVSDGSFDPLYDFGLQILIDVARTHLSVGELRESCSFLDVLHTEIYLCGNLTYILQAFIPIGPHVGGQTPPDLLIHDRKRFLIVLVNEGLFGFGKVHLLIKGTLQETLLTV